MLQLVYASAAVRPFTPADLTALLQKSRTRNSYLGVTGMLLYHSGSFLQVLEGSETSVQQIYASIQKDPRHTNEKLLYRGQIARPEFGQWSMGFENTSNSTAMVPGAVDYYRTLPALTIESTQAKRFLRFFQEGLCHQFAG
jgi:hypothetical protein